MIQMTHDKRRKWRTSQNVVVVVVHYWRRGRYWDTSHGRRRRGSGGAKLSHEDEDELGIRHMDVVGKAAGEEEEERDGSEMWECLTVGKSGSGREK